MAIKTTSLGTSKLLKEAGFRQDTYFYRLENGEAYPFSMIKEELQQEQFLAGFRKIECPTKYSAPTTDELLEALPQWVIYKNYRCDFRLRYTADGCKFWASFETIKKFCVEKIDESLPEALAACWLWLKKEKLI